MPAYLHWSVWQCRLHTDTLCPLPFLQVVDFYEFFEGLQEGWDGPALLVFSDGKRIGARLDRNGLRPARFWRTSDDIIYVASEVGVLGDVITNATNIVAKGRLGPGQSVLADLEKGAFSENAAISKAVASKKPYQQWVKDSVRKLDAMGVSSFIQEPVMEASKMLRLQAASGECLHMTCGATGFWMHCGAVSSLGCCLVSAQLLREGHLPSVMVCCQVLLCCR